MGTEQEIAVPEIPARRKMLLPEQFRKSFRPPPAELSLIQLPEILLTTAAKVHPGHDFTSSKHQLKFLVRGLMTPRLTADWFRLWQTPELSPLAQHHPRILMKLQRPYLHSGLSPKTRWKILRQHYSFALEHFSEFLWKQIATTTGFLLADLPATKAGHFSLRLAYDDIFEKEGELSVVLFAEEKQLPVFALTFCILTGQTGQPEIFIGGLQGYKAANEREYIVTITRAMFGLRPKALLLFALQQLATLWNIHHLRAVSNETRRLRRHKDSIQADYDQFWRDSGGQLSAGGHFTLPADFVPRELATIRPNKRTLYRHRYEMLAKVSRSIGQNRSQLVG